MAARRLRAEVKDGLRTGTLAIRDILDRRLIDPVIARMKVTDLLEALPGIGPVRAADTLEACHIAPSRRLRGLGEHQVAALLAYIGAAS